MRGESEDTELKQLMCYYVTKERSRHALLVWHPCGRACTFNIALWLWQCEYKAEQETITSRNWESSKKDHTYVETRIKQNETEESKGTTDYFLLQ